MEIIPKPKDKLDAASTILKTKRMRGQRIIFAATVSYVLSFIFLVSALRLVANSFPVYVPCNPSVPLPDPTVEKLKEEIQRRILEIFLVWGLASIFVGGYRLPRLFSLGTNSTFGRAEFLVLLTMLASVGVMWILGALSTTTCLMY